MFVALKNLTKYFDLLYMLTVRDIRVRYKQAAMGFLWAIFMPMIAVAAGILIKKAMSVVSGESIEMKDVVAISVKVLPWTFFIRSIRFAVQSLVGNSVLITKIYFPRAVLPLASIAACFFDFLISIVVLLAILVWIHLGVSIYLLWVPVILLSLILITIGFGLLLSAANLYFRDVKYIVEITLMFGIFFTPVFFEASSFGNWGYLFLLNPIGSILESLHQVVVLQQAPSAFWLSYAIAFSIFIFIVGLSFFHKHERSFAENI